VARSNVTAPVPFWGPNALAKTAGRVRAQSATHPRGKLRGPREQGDGAVGGRGRVQERVGRVLARSGGRAAHEGGLAGEARRARLDEEGSAHTDVSTSTLCQNFYIPSIYWHCEGVLNFVTAWCSEVLIQWSIRVCKEHFILYFEFCDILIHAPSSL